jgi:hypothetical protein
MGLLMGKLITKYLKKQKSLRNLENHFYNFGLLGGGSGIRTRVRLLA